MEFFGLIAGASLTSVGVLLILGLYFYRKGDR